MVPYGKELDPYNIYSLPYLGNTLSIQVRHMSGLCDKVGEQPKENVSHINLLIMKCQPQSVQLKVKIDINNKINKVLKLLLILLPI